LEISFLRLSVKSPGQRVDPDHATRDARPRPNAVWTREYQAVSSSRQVTRKSHITHIGKYLPGLTLQALTVGRNQISLTDKLMSRNAAQSLGTSGRTLLRALNTGSGSFAVHSVPRKHPRQMGSDWGDKGARQYRTVQKSGTGGPPLALLFNERAPGI
jgi:hypothetical protein